MKVALRWVFGLLILMLVVFGVTAWLVWQQSSDHIASGVHVQDIALEGLTVSQAASALESGLPAPETLGVTLQAAGQTWRITWRDVAQRYDYTATAQAAFDAGQKAGGSLLGNRDLPVAPLVVPADPTQVAAYLQQIAPMLYIAPTDATFAINGVQIVTTPGQAGRRLDVTASRQAVLEALAANTETVALTLATVPPQRALPEPANSRAALWLSQPFTLIADDPLTGELLENELPAGYHVEFSATPERIATWFVITPRTTDVTLYFSADAIRAWLGEVNSQLGAERLLDVETTLSRTLTALYAGQRQAEAAIRHPSRDYVVQAGDSLSLIAYNHKFPRWQLERANPGLEATGLDVGQVITIPSIDVLMPYPLVPGKRIEISLSDQVMQVFENEMQIYTFTISSGISRTPTIDGQFQILFKEEAAFARRWQLDMPYFMGIYEEGDGFYNGIHELPITAYGVRLSPSVLGWPASFGCIILDEGDAATLFNWAEVGTLVRISGYAPGTPTWQQTLADLAPLEEPQP
ncbi:MAG: peptidoglycan binding domain-containing protein [Anaerolineae bacterium]|nr:peptidoglycan binding domain-containing protein [Anaerolineae bacterium]